MNRSIVLGLSTATAILASSSIAAAAVAAGSGDHARSSVTTDFVTARPADNGGDATVAPRAVRTAWFAIHWQSSRRHWECCRGILKLPPDATATRMGDGMPSKSDMKKWGTRYYPDKAR